jgi:hypothetical protein
MINNQPGGPPIAPVGLPQTSVKAIVSLVFGIVSIFPLPIIGAIVALITGYSARKDIRESQGMKTGDGMAITGIVLGYVGMVPAVAVCVIVTLALMGPAIGKIFSGITESI